MLKFSFPFFYCFVGMFTQFHANKCSRVLNWSYFCCCTRATEFRLIGTLNLTYIPFKYLTMEWKNAPHWIEIHFFTIKTRFWFVSLWFEWNLLKLNMSNYIRFTIFIHLSNSQFYLKFHWNQWNFFCFHIIQNYHLCLFSVFTVNWSTPTKVVSTDWQFWMEYIYWCGNWMWHSHNDFTQNNQKNE